MTKVFLHGRLKKDYGAELNYSVDSVAEIFNAINANKKGFKKRMIADERSGLFYDVIVDGVNIDTPEDLAQYKEVPKVVHILPVISGADPSGGLITGAIFSAVGATSWAGVAIAVGKMILFSVIGGLISSMFAPKAERPKQTIVESSVGLNSYYFGGRLNRAQQGQPIPIVYGDLKVGSYVVQAGIRNLKKSEFDAL